MANLFITGALGHIGSRFIHSLRPGEFDKVYMIDNLSTQRYFSLFNLPDGVKFNFIEDDIVTADLDSLFSGIDVVIHLAAITDAASSFDKKEEVERVNFYGTKRVAEACIRNECGLIFPSTTSVYGVQNGIVDEDCSKSELKPQSPYAESKMKAEDLLRELKNKGLNFVICRFGTIFGPSVGMRFHTAVNKFCWQAIMGKSVTIWKDALHQKRPYLDIIDATESIKFIINKALFDGNVYNILTLNASVNEIIENIAYFIPDLSIEYVDAKILNQLSYNVSNERFKSLDFTFKGDLRYQLKETIKLLRGARSGQDNQ